MHWLRWSKDMKMPVRLRSFPGLLLRNQCDLSQLISQCVDWTSETLQFPNCENAGLVDDLVTWRQICDSSYSSSVNRWLFHERKTGLTMIKRFFPFKGKVFLFGLPSTCYSVQEYTTAGWAEPCWLLQTLPWDSGLHTALGIHFSWLGWTLLATPISALELVYMRR